MNRQFIIGLVLVIIFSALAGRAEKFTFRYKDPSQLKVVVPDAESRHEAFLKASVLCFRALTGGTYQGEERGLEIIDICANPIKD